jgi:hypothetical protein
MEVTKREFYVIIERDEDGYYVGEVPQLKACYSQGETIDELLVNMMSCSIRSDNCLLHKSADKPCRKLPLLYRQLS